MAEVYCVKCHSEIEHDSGGEDSDGHGGTPFHYCSNPECPYNDWMELCDCDDMYPEERLSH